MSTSKNEIKALDIGTGTVFNFSSSYRFGVNPKYIHAPPNFTVEAAFAEFNYLKFAPVGETVFIEWPLDRFSVLDAETNQYVPGPVVWRKAKILGRPGVPVKSDTNE